MSVVHLYFVDDDGCAAFWCSADDNVNTECARAPEEVTCIPCLEAVEDFCKRVSPRLTDLLCPATKTETTTSRQEQRGVTGSHPRDRPPRR